MNVCDEEIRNILKFYYKKVKNATNAANKIYAVYGLNAISTRVAQMRFKRFKSGNFSVEDEVRSGRPFTYKISAIFEKAIEKNRPDPVTRKGVVFHHDNARPHSPIATQQKLRELGWDVLMHPPYSPLAPSDFHLCQSLQNSLGSIKLTSKEHCEPVSARFF